MYRELFIE